MAHPSSRSVLLVACLALAPSCWCDADEAVVAERTPEPEAHTPDAVEGDPLLADARARIRGGVLPDDIVRALLASDDPAHARARRLLQAMHSPGELDDEEPEAEAVGVAPIVPPKISEAGGDVSPVPDTPSTGPQPSRTPAVASPTPKASARASLSAMSLSEHARGATLTLKASGGVVVGVANQPSSGIVRLVVESSGAAAQVVSARPRVKGARVTEVRAGTNTVIVTLELDPGWSLGKIERTSAGARVNLRRPD